MKSYKFKLVSEIQRDALAEGHLFFLDYFYKKTGGKRLPSRADLDPLDIPCRYLPFISLSDISYEDGHVVDNYFRLFGTGLVPLYSELTGQYITKISDQGVSARILDTVIFAVKSREPIIIYAQQLSDEKSFVPVNTLYMPLSNDNKTISQMLCYCYFTEQ